MKKILLSLFTFIASINLFSQQQNIDFAINPNTFNETDDITITFSNINPATWGVTDLYLWSWSYDTNDLNSMDAPNNGTWTNSNEAQKLTNNNNGTYSITLKPTTFYNRTGIGKIGFLVKAKDGSGDKKSQDMYAEVGAATPDPTVTEATLPSGMKDGLNLDPNDNTKATFVLYAPQKKFVNLIGSFNNWQRDDVNYLLKKDSAKDRFWIEVTNLTPQTNITYQYLVDGDLRIADPYSTTILDQNNDSSINATTYPNLPAYPTGKTEHAVSLFKTGEAAYNWQITNFTKPARTDLVIYELLIRDFDQLHSFDAVKNRLDYIQNLGVNVIELMPVSEFDGNESWGYNPSFHMALDKYYGTKEAFKQFIDECHKRGIAVILDVVYNHATGQNPYFRMWNTSNGGYGGQPAADSPFFNVSAKHSFNVFNDFNHSKQATKDYVKRTSQYWIDEFKIDGFRWDLTKGFTQNCSDGNDSCTNAYQADRVAVLKEYADYQWEKDADFYVIFEHLGTNQEETEWVNYRLNEGKGIMFWSNLNHQYNEATLGYHDSGKSDFSWIDYRKRNWTTPANISYMESHDEERLMYKNLQFGNSNGSYSVKNLATALERMKLAGAFYFTIPGPKMIWQFGELGYDISIEENGRTGNKPILWNYENEPNRKAIYDTWKDLIKLKNGEPIFKTGDFTLDVSETTGLKTIHLTQGSATGNEVKYVTIIGNFGVTTQSINPKFQETGDWYEFLNNNLKTTITDVNGLISLAPGEFKIFGNNPSSLFANNDTDGDGVLNSDDNCPNTPAGAKVDVFGCEIFTLPANNFSLQVLSETCRTSNNGSIIISAQKNLNYTATLTGNSVSLTKTFTTTHTFENLSAATYEVCITVDGQPNYKICFNSVITEPEDITVVSKIAKESNTVELKLDGSKNYNITLNDETYKTSNSFIELPLLQGKNTLKVVGDKDCQGIFEKTIYLGEEISTFPNPSTTHINVYLGTLKEKASIDIYALNGSLIYQTSANSETKRIDVSDLAKGMYILYVTKNNESKSFKIIKE
ncbi:T9SS type A sorting domain-containing protein [Tenacibaculum aiptasiae]|uniref:T9SS type A sorting domain-containing protein n=1 Tax=Tenacibaculum aiptasiae TaxID=426481 RepID=A0A7J5ALX8_9FLAO|nr:alpha-amylase family glycosyl hydrolase [Tenacibaculum aiptasiae]KAB1158601.1 T9SS type A sorting domain-containing protein [Tenacibaculum aiptasiae]